MTGLPNRALFSQLLKLTIDSSLRYKRSFAVLFIDLDRFKQINDSLGHEAGDTLLKEMSKRFRDTLRASDEQTMMKNADIAMYLAKEKGKNNFQFYSADIKSHNIEKMALEAQLRRALELDEFKVHYQAKVNIKTGEISGVAALLRWNNPILGSVSPAKFIPVAEEMGLIIPMGRSLGLTVVAEGVETAEQQAFLSDHACDEMQGFYFSKPIDPVEFEKLVRGHVPVPMS